MREMAREMEAEELAWKAAEDRQRQAEKPQQKKNGFNHDLLPS